MKNKKALLVGSMLMAFALTTTAGISALAETVSVGYPTSTNIARNLSSDAFTFTDYAGNTIEHVVAGPNVGADRTYTIANVNNGDIGSWDVVAPSADGTNKSLAWLNVDLGASYTIDKIAYTMNHDWSGEDVVIQVAKSADFSDAITIYNNDMDNSLGCGAVFSADASIEVTQYLSNYANMGKDAGGNGNLFTFTPVEGQYVRVTNNQYGNANRQNCTMIGEIGVYAFSNETPATQAQVAPVAFSKVSGTYGNAFSVELSTTQADAEIYYTLDGSVPTTSSLQYTGEITVPCKIIWRFVIWGVIGVWITLMMNVYKYASGYMMAQGKLPGVGITPLFALYTSVLMNTSFAPTFPVLVRVTETVILSSFVIVVLSSVIDS